MGTTITPGSLDFQSSLDKTRVLPCVTLSTREGGQCYIVCNILYSDSLFRNQFFTNSKEIRGWVPQLIQELCGVLERYQKLKAGRENATLTLLSTVMVIEFDIFFSVMNS